MIANSGITEQLSVINTIFFGCAFDILRANHKHPINAKIENTSTV